jgi:hypothetical protein
MTTPHAGITPRKKVIPAPKTSLILHAPCSQRGAIMRRLDGGAGRRRPWRCGVGSGGRCGKPRRLARRPRAWFAATHPGGFGNPPLGHYGPCARSSLTARFITGHASADRSWANAERHSLEPQQGAERRAGPRHGPVISGRSRRWTCRKAGHRVRRIRTSVCRRSAPLIFWEAETGEGAPAPIRPGRRSVGCLTIESELMLGGRGERAPPSGRADAPAFMIYEKSAPIPADLCAMMP